MKVTQMQGHEVTDIGNVSMQMRPREIKSVQDVLFSP